MSVYGTIQSQFPDLKSVAADMPSPYDDILTIKAKKFQPNPINSTIATLFTAPFRAAPHEVWHMETMIHWEEGLGQAPVAAPPTGTGGQNGVGVLPTPNGRAARQACGIPRMSAPYGYMMVVWVGRRVKLKPTPPKPDMDSTNAVFVAGRLYISPPIVHTDNTLMHSWSASYLFALKKPVWLLDDLNPGTNPCHSLTVEQNKITQAVYEQRF